MPSPFDKTKARKFATQAVENINAMEFTATPELFTVFFSFASGAPKGLKDELDDAFFKPGGFSEDFCYQLYEKYFTGADDAAMLVQALGSILETMGTVVNQQDASAAARTGALRRIQSTLGQNPNAEQLRRAILQLNEQFSKALEENAALKDSLASANSQITELNDPVEVATRSSLTDPLTGLGNRAAFDRRIREARQLMERSSIPTTLVLLDIDHFKSVNDTYGHAIGDEVLKVLAQTLETHARDSDYVARYGGEEFAAVLLGTQLIEGRRMAERLREAIAVMDLGEKARAAGLKSVTASFGVAEIAGTGTGQSWIELTDKALYRAKANGRNRVVSNSELTETKNIEEISVMVVEDDRISAQLTEAMLRKIGVKDVCVAANGSDALDLLAQRSVDCVVCDGVMPTIDGLEFTIRVRTGFAQSATNMPIMLLTARQEETWANAARDAGANEFVNKPVSLERLEGALRAMLFEPRKFIKSRGYVGPDRRTFEDPNYSGPERRGAITSPPAPAA
ncbi:MAG: diguanylate cyclase [Alphaproteobacteria bacterium]|nr:diguanylate cyclase [Alphaproteobacteria bacterium]